MPRENTFLPPGLLERLTKQEEEGHDLLLESLLWRGFLVGRDADGELGLYRGSHEQDSGTLRRCGLTTRDISTGEWCALIDSLDDPITPNVEQRLLDTPPKQSGMIGALMQNENESSFFRCQYGAKVPTAYLDPGIALMVKVLPVCGLRTVHSCQGRHAANRPAWPEINFHSKYDLKWATMIFEELASSLPAYGQLSWRVADSGGGGWLRWKIIFRPENDDVTDDAAYWETIESIQMAARQLLKPEVYEPIREAKASVNEFDKIRDALKERVRGLTP